MPGSQVRSAPKPSLADRVRAAELRYHRLVVRLARRAEDLVRSSDDGTYPVLQEIVSELDTAREDVRITTRQMHAAEKRAMRKR